MSTPVPEAYRELVESLVDAARATLEKCSTLAPVVVIGSVERSYVCPVGGIGDVPAAAAVQVVRTLCEKERADFVFIGWEVWMRRTASKQEVQTMRQQDKRVSDMPDRVDGLYFSVETYLGTWTALAPRVSTEGHYTFGEVTFRFVEESSSPFHDMLPRRAADTLQ